MGIQTSIHIPPGRDAGILSLKLDLLHRVSRGLSSADILATGELNSPLSGLVGSISFTHNNVFGGSEKLNVLLEKGAMDSNFLVNLKQPNSDGVGQRSITIQDSLAPATPVHGLPVDNFSGSVHGGVRMHRLTTMIDHSRPFRSKWTRTAGIRIERVGPIGDHGHPILEDLYGCPITFSGNPYDDMLVAKIEAEYADSTSQSFSQFNLQLEQSLPISSGWLNFSRFKVHARQGIKLGSALGLTSLSAGNITGDLAPYEAFSIGGFNSVRGYGEGAVGTGRSCLVASSELSFPLFGSLQGAIFADFGTDFDSGCTIRGDPAGVRGKPGTGFGYGAGMRIDSPAGPLRIDYAANDSRGTYAYFGLGYHE